VKEIRPRAPFAACRSDPTNRERRGYLGADGLRGPASDHVRPESNVGAREVAPQHVEPLVPIVELYVIRALEARSPELEHL